MNTSRSYFQAKQSFGHGQALVHHAGNVGTGAGGEGAAAAAAAAAAATTGRSGGYCGPRPPGVAAGGRCPRPREPILMQVERIQVHLSDMACLISNYNMREFR